MENEAIKIPLHETHESLGAKIIPFAGYLMPVRYTSDIEEHNCVRQKAGIFDVSHMGEFIVRGPKALDLIQYVCSNDAAKLKPGGVQYSCFPNHEGGIVDDLLVYCIKEEEYMLVVNASNIEKDWAWINEHNSFGAELENISEDIALFAIQGPLAIDIVQKITRVDLSSLAYYTFTKGNIGNDTEGAIFSHTGYTGEKGIELYMYKEYAKKAWDALMAAGEEFGMQPIGLGARDTLRLEMGYSLYGNDIDDTTSPIEAGLGWITKFNKDFVNAEYLLAQKQNGVKNKLVGFEMIDKGIPRKDYEIYSLQDQLIGRVTSGTQSPSLGHGIGMGYVTAELAETGTEILIEVRKKRLRARVVKPPFYKK